MVNYVQWSPEFDRFCGDASRQMRVYCSPQFFEGLPNMFFSKLFEVFSAPVLSHLSEARTALGRYPLRVRRRYFFKFLPTNLTVILRQP